MENQYYDNDYGEVQTQPKKKVKKSGKSLAAHIVLLITAAVLAASFFLPYASMTGENSAEYESFYDTVSGIIKTENFETYEKAEEFHKDITILDARDIVQKGFENEKTVYNFKISDILFGAYALFTFAIFFFALIKKGIPTVIFCVLDFFYSGIIAVAMLIAFKETGDIYTIGIGLYVHLVSNVLSFSFAAWLTSAKSKEKEEKRHAKLKLEKAQRRQQVYAQQGYADNNQYNSY